MANQLFPLLLLGAISNLDNLGIGISYGVQKIRIPFQSNLLIAFLTGIVTIISVSIGNTLKNLVHLANVMGALFFIIIGVWIVFSKPKSRNYVNNFASFSKTYSIAIKSLHLALQITKDPSKADQDSNGCISLHEAMFLGVSLSFNCLATGVGAGLTGLSPLGLTVFVFVFSLITIEIGYTFGKKAALPSLGRWSQALSGLLLVIIGLFDLF